MSISCTILMLPELPPYIKGSIAPCSNSMDGVWVSDGERWQYQSFIKQAEIDAYELAAYRALGPIDAVKAFLAQHRAPADEALIKPLKS